MEQKRREAEPLTEPDKAAFSVHLRGTRGTLACPGRQYERAGGNTCCIEIACGKRLLVLDAGSGIKPLGEELIKSDGLEEIDILLTHAHYDHVEGLPFFMPFYKKRFTINVWAGGVEGCRDTRDLVASVMSQPCFPVGPEVFDATVNYHEFAPNQTLDMADGISIQTAPMNHPGGATGFRVEYGGKVFSLITDTEHEPGNTDENVVKLVENADLFVYDACFVEEEMVRYQGFGHSSWEEAERICKLAGAARALAGHHSPFRKDAEIDRIESRFVEAASPVAAAREGDIIDLL